MWWNIGGQNPVKCIASFKINLNFNSKFDICLTRTVENVLNLIIQCPTMMSMGLHANRQEEVECLLVSLEDMAEHFH